MTRHVLGLASVMLVAACGFSNTMGPCELATPQNCSDVLLAARNQVGIASGTSVRIVRPIGGPARTSADVGLVIVTDADGSRHLILVGYVGIDPSLHAWVPSQVDYRAWYDQYGAT